MRKKSLLLVFLVLSFFFVANAEEWPVPASKKIGGAYGDYRGSTKWGFHTGIDIEAPQGSEVKAVAGGKVVRVWPDGTQLLIKVNGVYHCYAHLQNIVVKKGKKVEAGQKIAEVGKFRRYNHLHFNLEDKAGNPTIDNPLSILDIQDSVAPMVEEIHFRNQDDETKYFETTSASVPGAIIIWGKVDIIARVSDVIGERASVRPGIYKIGYKIPEAPLGVTPMDETQWLVEFTGALPESLYYVYSHSGKCKSKSYEFYYIVTNTGTDPDRCWNTSDNGKGGKARINAEAVWKEGEYKIKIDAYDKAGNSDTTERSKKKVVVDNFCPYVCEVEIFQERKYTAPH